MGSERGSILSRLAWRLKSSETVKLDSVKVLDSKYIGVYSGARQRMFAFMRVNLADSVEDQKLDYASTIRITLQQQRMKGLFDGLHKAGIPFLYVSMMAPALQEDEKEVFEFDLVVGTWVDSKGKEAEDSAQGLEERASVLAATLTVALPSAAVRRLTRGELRSFVNSLLLPREPNLPQVGTASVMTSLGPFEDRAPSVGQGAGLPRFYVPNSSESGKGGILLGSLVTPSGEAHDMRIQLEDLKRHATIVGMTGSGKSTTAAAVVRQLAEMGLPVLVLVWHNEYGPVVAAVGGQVVSPGKDDFAINPIEAGPGTEPTEHIAMVTDIFSDIYHFTHPQAYMFRNALQKCLTESSDDEERDLNSLVRTIESYPLRSAYDNETKVALLRRLVPLTQGQAGRALVGKSTGLEELLSRVVCIELGHLRDMQTRSVFSDIVLKMIYEQRVRRKSGLEHLTVVEEARNLAPARRPEDPPSVGERMISELRKFGEAMMFVAQFPTQLAPEIMKNSGVRVIHRVAWPEDVELLGDALSLGKEQREHITKLPVGEAVVSVSRIQHAMLIQIRGDSVLSVENRDLNFAAEA